jgi:hypothetical protein
MSKGKKLMGDVLRRIRSARCLGLVLFVLALAGCGEKEVPYVVDADEIIRYVAETTEGKQLFAWENFILPTPYEVPSDSAVYRDSLIAHTRGFKAYVLPVEPKEKYADWGPLGMLREAMVLVLDTFQIQTTRQYASDTLIDTSWRSLGRLAFFLKLGDDDEEYVGWVMWGYNGSADAVPDAVVRVRLYDNSEFSADGSMYEDRNWSNLGDTVRFVRVDELNQIVVGSRVVIKISRDPAKPPVWHLISGMDTSGVFMRPMVTRDTLSIDTIRSPYASQQPPQYGLYYIQSFRKSDSRLLQSYCIPFRMNR